jgi:hypothetical protein
MAMGRRGCAAAAELREAGRLAYALHGDGGAAAAASSDFFHSARMFEIRRRNLITCERAPRIPLNYPRRAVVAPRGWTAGQT